MHAPEPAAPTRPGTSIHETWDTYARGPLAARTPAGPYGELESACRQLARTPKEQCEVRGTDDIEGTRLGIAAVRYWAEVEGDAMSAPISRSHGIDEQFVAIRTASGMWYVLPHFAELGLRHLGLHVQPEIVDDVLLLRYRHTHGSKWSGDTDTGVVACKVDHATLSCTPKIVLRKTSYRTTDRMDPGGIQEATLACGASYADGKITIAPLEEDMANDRDYWTAEAAKACVPAMHRIAF